MEQYSITGMSCAACSARVEKAVSSVEGVTNCSVSLLTNSMGVEGTASAEAIISAVEKAGYGASVKNDRQLNKTAENDLTDKQTPRLVKRLCFSIGFLVVLMYVSMGHMLSFPVPDILLNKTVSGIVQMFLSAVVMVINRRFFIKGFKGLIW